MLAGVPAEYLSAGTIPLLQCTTQVVDSIAGVTRIHDFKHYVIAGFELANHGIELFFGAGRLLVDANDDQPRFKPLQVSK